MKVQLRERNYPSSPADTTRSLFMNLLPVIVCHKYALLHVHSLLHLREPLNHTTQCSHLDTCIYMEPVKFAPPHLVAHLHRLQWKEKN